MNLQIFFLTLLLFHVVEPYSIINDPSLLRVLFGNLSDMSDLYLSPSDGISIDEETEKEKAVEKEDMPDLDRYFPTIDDLIPTGDKSNMFTQDIEELNALSKSLRESLKKSQNATDLPMETRKRSKYDWEERGYHEETKKEDLINNMLTFLIHTRFMCDVVIRQRKESRDTKHYRLGYLFNRLRRIKYSQAKIIHEAFQYYKYNERFYYKRKISKYDVNMLLRFYQKMMYLDVDMRDVLDLIQNVIET